MKRLLVGAVALATVAVIGGAFAWWTWGALVTLEALVRFCL
jgi:hypothetical protein